MTTEQAPMLLNTVVENDGQQSAFTFDTSGTPPEIWLKIFSYLSPPELRASSLTCSSFRWLAQPMLFTIIDVSPFFLAYNVDHYILRPSEYLERTVERLQFYRSPHIAPAVTYAWISPYSRRGCPPRNPKDQLDPNLIINHVLATLPWFPNLRKLSWHCNNISTEWWNIIHKLPITDLWLNSCIIEGVDPPLLPVQHLDLDQWAWEGQITNHVSIHEEYSSGVSQNTLSTILHPEHINYISVPRMDTCTRLLSVIVNMDACTSLRVLHVPFLAISSSDFVQALIQCPYLEELQIFNPTDNKHHRITMEHLPSTALRSLSVYEGPYTYLPTFGIGRPLKKVSVWGQSELPAHCDPHRLAETLHQISLLNSTLESLYVSVAHITTELISAISNFTQLKNLDISSVDSPTTEGTTAELHHRCSSSSPITLLYATLKDVQLPVAVESLRISTKLNHGNLDIPTQQQEAMRAFEQVADRNPSIRHVEIGYGTYWTGTFTVRWNRRDRSCGTETLGNVNFSERRRTIVLPDADETMLESRWGAGKAGERGISLFAWLRYLYYKYF